MRMNEALEEVLSSRELPAYANEAPTDAKYPYAVFKTKRITSGTVCQYRLTVNVWDQRDTWNRAETIADKLERNIDHTRFEFDSGGGMSYKDTCESNVVEDKKLKKVELTFEVRTVEE